MAQASIFSARLLKAQAERAEFCISRSQKSIPKVNWRIKQMNDVMLTMVNIVNDSL
jgi:hypothetical protein